MMGDRIEILDKGYVEHIETFGDDTSIARFARGSFGEVDYKDPEKNDRLVRYLLEHRHMSPIEAGGMSFRVKVPIFVARQLMRHRTCSFNELSLRYTEHEGDYYLPDLDRIGFQDPHNKQGTGEALDPKVASHLRDEMKDLTDKCISKYNSFVSYGMAKETARIILPVSMYTVIFMKCDTRNLLNFLSLRDDSHAQYEIQVMAQAIDHFMKRDFPALHGAYEDFMKNAVTFSAKEIEIIRGLIDANAIEALDGSIYGSKRRMKDFKAKLKG
jgi:thymidylate synthase (FAD)